VQRLGQVGHHLFQHLKDRAILDQVKIIQDQQELAIQVQDVIDEGRVDDLDGGKLSSAQDTLDLPAQLVIHLLQRSHKVGEKAPRVIIRSIQGQPGNWTIQRSCPLADAGGFSKSGWCRYERNLPAGLEPFIQPLNEMRALDSLGRNGRMM
jgi:hypothetical protein